MHRPSLILAVTLAVTIVGVSAEYIWTGTEWKWQEPGSSSASSTSSDDSYDEDYDYEEEFEVSKPNNKQYDFNDYGKNSKKDKKQREKKNRNKNRDSQFYPSNSNSAILPATDDEDLFDGSGDDDSTVYRSPVGNNQNSQFLPTNGNSDNLPPTDDEDMFETSGDYRSPVDNNNNNNNNQFNSPTEPNNVYYDDDEDDDDDKDVYDYDEDDIYVYDEDEDDITYTDHPIDPTDGIHNNFNPTTSTTIRSFTTKKVPVQSTPRPDSGTGREAHNPIPVNRPASFFAQPGILAAVIGGAVVGLLCAILLVMFIVYRMRKKDEGSYALDDSKRSHNVNSYSKPPNREFYA